MGKKRFKKVDRLEYTLATRIAMYISGIVKAIITFPPKYYDCNCYWKKDKKEKIKEQVEDLYNESEFLRKLKIDLDNEKDMDMARHIAVYVDQSIMYLNYELDWLRKELQEA